MVLDEEARTLNEVVRKQEHLITVLREELNNSTARMRLKEEQEAMRGWKRWQALQRRMDCHTPGIRRSAPPTEDEDVLRFSDDELSVLESQLQLALDSVRKEQVWECRQSINAAPSLVVCLTLVCRQRCAGVVVPCTACSCHRTGL